MTDTTTTTVDPSPAVEPGPPVQADATGNPFADLDAFVGVPRLSGLCLSPTGDRLVTTVSVLDGDGSRSVPALWALDPAGDGPARRLTRSDKGESSPTFASNGSLLFLSARPRPGGKDDDPAGVWVLPAGGGEPWPVATHPGGISAVIAASHAPVVAFMASVAPAGHHPDEEGWHAERSKRKVTAILHEDLPIRQWDHERGPEEAHLFVGTLPDPGVGAPTGLAGVRDLTPGAGGSLHDASPVVSPDGSAVVTDWEVALGRGRIRTDLVRIDVADGTPTVLASHPDGAWSYAGPAISPDGSTVVCLRESLGEVDKASEVEVWVVGLDGNGGHRVDVGAQLWPGSVAWTADSTAVVVSGDLAGHHPAVRADLTTGAVTMLTGDGAFGALTAAPDGSLFALRSSVSGPTRPVRLDPTASHASPSPLSDLDAPGALTVPGRVEEVTATAADGTALRAWLVLPDGASDQAPAPLVLWVHGGPYGSWNDWSWRWNPWLMAARGWAVLLPDPAFSTGYGMDFIARGWGQWGGNPYTDVMAMTDVAVERSDVDGSRTAMMGGSYGGYMANWIAGHTNRFAAIVSHASIWSVEQFRATTDHPEAWTEQWGRPEERPEYYRRWSPDTYVDAISTPMLVIHGNDDYRCPVSESVRLWTDLFERGKEAKFLSFPEENHWILKPGDATVWYGAVFAFLDHHVLGRPWERPALL